MMQRSCLVLLFLTLLDFLASVHSFVVPSAPVNTFRYRLASSVQIQTLSDESSATEEPTEVSEPKAIDIAPPPVVGESEPVVADDASTEVLVEGEEQNEAVAESTSVDTDETPNPVKRKVERIRHTAFVGNLPYDTTEAEVREHFSTHGTVQLINLPKDRMTGTPRGFAFIDFASEEELESVVNSMHEVEFRDRPLRVAKSLPQDKLKKPSESVNAIGGKLYVGNLPFDITNDEIKEFFSEYGETLDVFIPLNEDGSGRGFAFITVKSEDLEKIMEATNGYVFEGRALVVNKPLPPGQKAVRKNSARKKIYIGNLSFDTISETIESLFGEFGEVLDCYLPRDIDTGSSRGFGFVSMAPEAADAAIYELDGCEVDGRVIRVNEAMEKKDMSYAMKSENDDGEEDYA